MSPSGPGELARFLLLCFLAAVMKKNIGECQKIILDSTRQSEIVSCAEKKPTHRYPLYIESLLWLTQSAFDYGVYKL